jgi:hypothetical protein
LFLLVAFLLGAARARYDATRMPISLLAVGRDGWTQITNFVVCGVLMLAFAAGLHLAIEGRGARWAPILFGLIGIGLIGAGPFATDPGLGFPPAGQAEPGPTFHGHLHDVFSAFVFVGFPAAAFVMASYFTAHHDHRWALGTRVCAWVLAVGSVLVLVAFNQDGALGDDAGVIQRCWVTIAFASLTALSIRIAHGMTISRPSPDHIGTANP